MEVSYDPIPGKGETRMSTTNLKDDEKAALKNIYALLSAFKKIRPTMPLQHAVTFVLVAMDEGQGVLEYAERADVAQTVMTRHLLDIGSQNRFREPGYGLLIQRQDPLDLRKHQTFLTREGRALLHEIVRCVR